MLLRRIQMFLGSMVVCVAVSSGVDANGTAAPLDKPKKSTVAEVRTGVQAYRDKAFDRAYTLLRPWGEKGDREAQYYLGRMYENGEGRDENKEQAVKWYRASAEGGFARAQYKVAAGYLYGYGPVKKDEAKAREWLIKAAEGGYRRAQRILAEGYRRGEIGLPVDADKAAYWSKQAGR